MKNVKNVCIAIAMVLGLSASVKAQKVAHIDFEKLVAEMPETKKLQTELEKLAKTLGEDIQFKQKQLSEKVQKYTAEGKNQSVEINKKRAEEVKQDEYKLQQLQVEAQKSLQQKENELLKPIVEKARKTIEAVCEAKGIAYVIDSKALIVAKGEDISAAVKTKLGIK